MRQRAEQIQATYGPVQQKTFGGALDAFFAQECPQLGGERTRKVLVQWLTQLVDAFSPDRSRRRQGQIQWTAVASDELGAYGKRITQSRLTSVVLDLVAPGDAQERAEGRKLRDIRRDAIARLYQQAYDQGGCLTHADVAVLLKLSHGTVSKHTLAWEAEHKAYLPRRGVVHDLGPTLTHKREIVRRLYLEGRKVEDVCHETHHSPEAVHRYITAFKQVLLCQRKGFSPQETAYALKMSPRLVREYLSLIRDFAAQNLVLESLLKDPRLS